MLSSTYAVFHGFIHFNHVSSPLNISLAQQSFLWHKDDIIALAVVEIYSIYFGYVLSWKKSYRDWHYKKRDCDYLVRLTRNMKVKKYIFANTMDI